MIRKRAECTRSYVTARVGWNGILEDTNVGFHEKHPSKLLTLDCGEHYQEIQQKIPFCRSVDEKDKQFIHFKLIKYGCI